MRLTVEETYRAHADAVFAAAFSVCRSRADADDVVQDTFLRYLTKPKEFDSAAHLKAWLLRVAINRATDLTRSRWRDHLSWEEEIASLPFEAPEDERLMDAVLRLQEQDRIVVHLYYFEGYSVKEIARLIQRREGTVKSRLSRARAALKTMLKEEWNVDEP